MGYKPRAHPSALCTRQRDSSLDDKLALTTHTNNLEHAQKRMAAKVLQQTKVQAQRRLTRRMAVKAANMPRAARKALML